MERLRVVKHRMRDILVADLRNTSPQEIISVLEAGRIYITSQPRESVLTMVLLENSDFNKEAITKMKEVATYDRPHVIRSAFVGADSLPKVFHNALETFSRREFPNFATEQEALDWLVEDKPKAAEQASRRTG